MSDPPGGSCLACGGAEQACGFEAKGLPDGAPRFRLARCAACGLGATVPPVPEADIGRWYPPSYYGKENERFNPLFERLVRLFRWRRARVIRRWTHGPGGPSPAAGRAGAGSGGPRRVLDVGCGRGFMLRYLREMGFEPHGVEISPEAAWHARRRLGLDIHVGDILETPYRPGEFAAVIFWHSLEHLARPIEALRRAHELLRPGGLLVVAVPNSESLQASLSGPDWFHLDIPRHYWHFGTRSLNTLLRRLGFEPVQIDHFSFEQNPYGWIQSLYNSAGLEFNLLYSVLKNRSARLVPLRRHPFQALALAATLPAVVPLALALTVLEAALKRGGTIEVYAVKS